MRQSKATLRRHVHAINSSVGSAGLGRHFTTDTFTHTHTHSAQMPHPAVSTFNVVVDVESTLVRTVQAIHSHRPRTTSTDNPTDRHNPTTNNHHRYKDNRKATATHTPTSRQPRNWMSVCVCVLACVYNSQTVVKQFGRAAASHAANKGKSEGRPNTTNGRTYTQEISFS